jgi:methionyl-tRNA formyltransferase
MSPSLPTKARIALFTVRSFAIEQAIPVIKEHPGAELACVVTTPGPKARRSSAHLQVMDALHRLGHHSVDVICTNQKKRWADLLALYSVNLVLVSGFPWLIPPSVLDDPRLSLGVINFHNSHLPRFMGPNAFGWHIVSGEEAVGYCCHRMSADFDTGPILFTQTVPLDVNEDYLDLKAKMPPVFRGMIEKAIDLALEGNPGVPQEGRPSRAPKFTDDFRWIDFGSTARDVHNKVRAFYGERDHPRGALARMDDGSTICITKTRWRPPVKVVVDGELPLPMRRVVVVGAHAATTPDADGTDAMSSAAVVTPTPAALLSSSPPLIAVDQDPDIASLASLTTLSSESLTASSLDVISGGGNATGSPPGAASSAMLVRDSDHHAIPFFVQCGDMALEVLEWHRVVLDEDETTAAAAAADIGVVQDVAAAVAASEAAVSTVRTSTTAAAALPAVAITDLFS